MARKGLLKATTIEEFFIKNIDYSSKDVIKTGVKRYGIDVELLTKMYMVWRKQFVTSYKYEIDLTKVVNI